MTQQSHSQAYTLRKPKLKKTHVSHCSLQHYLQKLEHGSTPLQYSCLENPMEGEAWQATSPWGRKELDMTGQLHFPFSFKVYAQEWDCWVTLWFYSQYFKESPYCLPQWLYQFTFPPTVQECSLFSTPSPAFIVCRLFDDGHSDWCEVISHCSFDLHFSDNERC